MYVEGKVTISIQDFDELRRQADALDDLKREIKACVKNHYARSQGESLIVIEDESEYETMGMDEPVTQIISINAKKVVELLSQFTDLEELYEDDIIEFINVEPHYNIDAECHLEK